VLVRRRPLGASHRPDEIDDDDSVEHYLAVTDVEPGKIWFENGVGPISMPQKASDLARPAGRPSSRLS
jgi:hypothetical protein